MARAKDLGIGKRSQKKTKKPPLKSVAGKKGASSSFLPGTKPRGVKP